MRHVSCVLVVSHDACRMSHDEIDCVILCGGRGSRLGSLTDATPKPLLEVGGVPFLLKVLRRLQQEGFRRFFLAACYLAEQFEAFAGKHRGEFGELILIPEKNPLGTGGALKQAAVRVASNPFVALNGDSWVVQPLAPILAQHRERKSPFTMAVVPSDQVIGGAYNKGGVQIGKNGEVLQFFARAWERKKWVSAGLYVVDREKALAWPEGPFDLETNLLSLLKPGRAQAFLSEEKLLDIGTKDCLEQARGEREVAG